MQPNQSQPPQPKLPPDPTPAQNPQPQNVPQFVAPQQTTLIEPEAKVEGDLINEPSIAAVSVSTEMLNSPLKPEKKKPLGWVLVVLAVIIILGVAGYFVYTKVFNKEKDEGSGTGSTKLTLVQASAQNTNYLRPQSWNVISEVGGSYGEGGDGNGIWASSLVVDKNEVQQLYVNASDATYETLRSKPDDIIIQGFGKPFLQKTGKSCSGDISVDTASDALVKGNTVGLYVTTATCQTEDGAGITLKLRTVIGKDGAKRTIMLTASNDTWKNNAEPFKEILESIEQAS